MHALGLHVVDICVIMVYFSAVLFIGYRALKRVKNQEDFFLGGRQFGRFFQTFSQFGQATSSESAVQTVSAVGANGLVGAVNGAVRGIMVYPVAWLFPKWLRRLRLMSMSDYFVDRFKCRKLAALYAVAQACLFTMVGGMGLYAMSKTVVTIAERPATELTIVEKAEYERACRLEALEGKPHELLTDSEVADMRRLRHENPRRRFSYINQNVLIVCIAVFVLLYAAGGGLEAAVYTDAMQSVFILILTVLLVPFAMVKLNALNGETGFLGPFRALHRLLPESMFEVFGSPRWAEFKWYNMGLLVLASVAGNISFSNNLVVSGAARTEKVASFGGLTGSLLKGGGALLWMVMALLILGIFGEQVPDPDLLWGMAARALLPVGLLGLMIACLLAALMSTADTHMVTVSGLLMNNIYKPLVPGKNETHYVNSGRVLGLFYVIGAVLFAVNASSIFKMWKFMVLINLCSGPPMLVGFLWRRANAKAVWASMGTALAITLLIPLLVTLVPGARRSPGLLLEAPAPRIDRIYAASRRDVREREQLIKKWDMLKAVDKTEGERPEPLAEGEKFKRTYTPPDKAVFWDEGTRRDERGLYGAGLFRAELYLFHLLGVDFARRTPAQVEFIGLLFRLVFPFAAVFVVGLLTKPSDKDHLDRFYAKLRTPVEPDPEEDRKEMEKTLNDPSRFDDRKLFPRSDWEFGRLPAYDRNGMIVGALVGLALATLVILAGMLGR